MVLTVTILQEIVHFKDIVKSYIKMNQIAKILRRISQMRVAERD